MCPEGSIVQALFFVFVLFLVLCRSEPLHLVQYFLAGLDWLPVAAVSCVRVGIRVPLLLFFSSREHSQFHAVVTAPLSSAESCARFLQFRVGSAGERRESYHASFGICLIARTNGLLGLQRLLACLRVWRRVAARREISFSRSAQCAIGWLSRLDRDGAAPAPR